MLAAVTISDGMGEPVELHNLVHLNTTSSTNLIVGLAKNLEMKMKHGVMPKQTLSLKLYSDVLETVGYCEVTHKKKGCMINIQPFSLQPFHLRRKNNLNSLYKGYRPRG